MIDYRAATVPGHHVTLSYDRDAYERARDADGTGGAFEGRDGWSKMGRWGSQLDASIYLPSPGLTFAERRAEQDRAAGGRINRQLQREDGLMVTASVALRPLGRRVYAYLRWSAPEKGRTQERYVGDVTVASNRDEALLLAWKLILDSRGSDNRD